jgi:hypothetical protein
MQAIQLRRHLSSRLKTLEHQITVFNTRLDFNGYPMNELFMIYFKLDHLLLTKNIIILQIIINATTGYNCKLAVKANTQISSSIV